MRQTKAQSSVEYVFIVALALLIIIPGSMIFYSFSSNSQNSLLNSQVFKVGNTLIDVGMKIYSIGDNSWQTIDVSVPENIDKITIYTSSSFSELVIDYGTEIKTQGIFFSEVPLCNESSCDCSSGCQIPVHSGLNNIRIASNDGKIYYKVLT